MYSMSGRGVGNVNGEPDLSAVHMCTSYAHQLTAV